ncbi:unnamed protein product [Kuraishia capsulata CBS 1993]|uniref:Uncharacterized protein n=1 Tax=Kuraishia capsulata CBS 1993 TaxID=1382522 RepID=W6MTB1_9ASCO|nr:uncharacterized protein KUCA_T00005636001 [Kuraishia capsulata CBS 1993]CDK29643.1 unnamed protein product [Kuraishia capsulata CBS 1993]
MASAEDFGSGEIPRFRFEALERPRLSFHFRSDPLAHYH